jgi:type 1 fimbria pilin
MKVSIIATAVALLFAGTASAQHVNLGVKGGVNIYNINQDGANYDSKVGFNAGLLGHIHLAPQLALQPEIVYSSQGAKANILNTDLKINLGYINVPVMLQYMFDNGFRLQAGPQVGFLISGKQEINNVKTDIKDGLKKVDFGIGAGIGYVHTPSGFGVDARYNLGLTDINDNSGNNNTQSKATNRGVQIGVFYLFKHK